MCVYLSTSSLWRKPSWPFHLTPSPQLIEMTDESLFHLAVSSKDNPFAVIVPLVVVRSAGWNMMELVTLRLHSTEHICDPVIVILLSRHSDAVPKQIQVVVFVELIVQGRAGQNDVIHNVNVLSSDGVMKNEEPVQQSVVRNVRERVISAGKIFQRRRDV